MAFSKNLVFMIMDLSKMDFDANASNSTAISDDESIHLLFQSEFAFTKDIKNFLIIAFIDQSFTKGSAILRNNFNNPDDLIVQTIPVKKSRKIGS